MRLEQEDLNAIGEIVVSRYFKKGGLKYTSLRDPRRIFKAYNEVDDGVHGVSLSSSSDW